MAYRYKLNTATFSDETTVELGNLVVIVGPNNCGKSRALRELLELATLKKGHPKVVRSVESSLPNAPGQLKEAYPFLIWAEEDGNYLNFLEPDLRRFHREDVNFSWSSADGETGVMENRRMLGQFFSPQLILILKAESRLALVSKKPGLKDMRSIENVLQVLYKRGSHATREVSSVVCKAFPQTQVALDYTVPQHLEFRVGTDFSRLPEDPRDALPEMSKFERLDDQGDGLRAFVGLVTAVKALNRPVVLIDEPESFLHPPQAFQMGLFLANEAHDGRQIVVATHSPDVLRGIIFAHKESNVIRIDRSGTRNLVKQLSKTELDTVIRDPLLSASGVISGLFYRNVIVTEGDADSRLYQALSARAKAGVDTHYINADNKQTVPRIMAIYKRLGVRCAGVVDIDALNDDKEFRAQLNEAGVGETEFNRAREARNLIDAHVRDVPPIERLQTVSVRLEALTVEIKQVLNRDQEEHAKSLSKLGSELARIKAESSPWSSVKKDAVSALKDCEDHFAAVYQICSEAGLFINPCGELEAVLDKFGVPWSDNKREWIGRALKLVANLEPNPKVHPWKFILSIHAYLEQLPSTAGAVPAANG